MIKLNNVSKFYYQDGVIATGFTKVNLELHIGEFVVITGESGSGKSSLLNVISGLDTYEEGEMYINGEETSHYTEEDFVEYRKKYVTNIFQSFNLVNSYTVYQNIELALLLDGSKKSDVKKKVDELINLVNMKKFRNTKVSKLSGGQKQRVAIARALAYDTPIIVADEPTGSLDRAQSKSILELLHKISKDKLVIIVTHNKKEVEEYATRLIRMHDGRLLENKVVEKINKDDEVKLKEVKDISLFSMIRLGIRNTFNIPIKFILIFIIFLFITLAFVNSYSSIESAKYQMQTEGYNAFFKDADIKRIVINKVDKTPITNDDYLAIENISDVDHVIVNDLLNDLDVSIWDDDMYSFYGFVKSSNYIDSVDEGRLPTNKNEIVIGIEKDYMYFTLEDILKSNFKLYNSSFDNILASDLKIVGVKYEEGNDFEYNMYLNDELLNEIKVQLNRTYSKTKIKVNDNYLDNDIYGEINRLVPNKLVKDGEALVYNDLNNYCKYNWCINKNLNIEVENIYYNERLELKITNLYNKNNFKTLTGLKGFDNHNGNIFISYNDYNKLYNKDNYQSSVIVKDSKKVEKVNKELEGMGYNTLMIKKSLFDDLQGIKEIFNIIKLVLTAILLIGLFFISYFVIKLILKSRNAYFATIRTLGAKRSVSNGLLIIELLFNATIAYSVFMILVYLINNDILKIASMKNLLSFVIIRDYILIYLLLLFMALLISLRYSRKVFKDSVIKVYGERV